MLRHFVPPKSTTTGSRSAHFIKPAVSGNHAEHHIWVQPQMPSTNTTKAITAKTLLNTTAIKAASAAVDNTVADEKTQTGQVQKAFTDVIKRLQGAEDLVSEQKGLLEGEEAKRDSLKVKLVIELAELADKNGWNLKYCEAGIDAALAAYEKASNSGWKAASMSQFRGECLRAMHPFARKHIASDFEQADEMWAEEGEKLKAAREEAKAADEKFVKPDDLTPLRDTFKRKWHMVVGSKGTAAQRAVTRKDVAEQEALRELADDPLELAAAHNEADRIDPKKAAKAVKKAMAAIAEVNATFPHKDFQTVLDFLSEIDTEKLQKAYAASLRKAAQNARRTLKRDESDDDGDDLIDE
jgi:hypothetical protein